MDYQDSFGRWLQHRRRQLDLTQAELADRVGCSRVMIKKIEADERRPSKQIAERLAQCLDLPDADHPAFIRFARGESSIDIPEVPSTPFEPIPARRSSRPLSNMPEPTTPLLGRVTELDTIVAYLRRPEVRQVTLTGPGGIGKTRLSLAVATVLQDEFEDGVAFVPLAPLGDTTLVTDSIALALGVVDTHARPLLETLKDWLRERHILLVLDNFEHLIDAAPVLAALLAATRRLKLLVTSRTVLHLYGEHEYPVPGLPTSSGVELFTARARATRLDFQLSGDDHAIVGQICTRLDGLPLAIELAAARAKLLPPGEILQRLNDRFALLTGGGRERDARQQTLRGTLDWSYQLLDADEQRLLRSLAVFRSGWTLPALEYLAASQPIVGHQAGDTPSLPAFGAPVLDLVQSLVDKSLVRYEGAWSEPQSNYPVTRYTMLETIRDYADLLHRAADNGIDESATLQRRHANYYLWLAEAAMGEFSGQRQAQWSAVLDREYGNLRAALAWAVEHHEAEVGLRLAVALWRFWLAHGYLSEGRRWLKVVLADEEHQQRVSAHAALLASAYAGAGGMAQAQGDDTQATQFLERSLILARRANAPTLITTALNGLGLAAHARGDLPLAVTLLEEAVALAQTYADRRNLSIALNYLGMARLHMGQGQVAATLLGQSLQLARDLEHPSLIAITSQSLALLALLGGNVAQARDLFVESLHLCRAEGEDVRAIYCLEGLAGIGTLRGAVEQATRLIGACEAYREERNAPLSGIVRQQYDQFVAIAYAALGEAQWTSLRREGRALTIEQAIDLALSIG